MGAGFSAVSDLTVPVAEGEASLRSFLCTVRKQTECRRHQKSCSSRPATIVLLPPDAHLRIAWAVAAGRARMTEACAFSMTCSELFSVLQEPHHRLWAWKVGSILSVGKSGSSSRTNSITPRLLCISLLIVGRLLQSALTNCDWLALFDVSEVLLSVGLSSHQAGQGAAPAAPFFVTLRALLGAQCQPPTPQALRWLWDLAIRRERPWSGASRPTAEVVHLDGLRGWLHRHVAASILPWHKLKAFRLDSSYDGLFPQEAQDTFAGAVGCTAAALLFVAECLPMPSDACVEAVVSSAELVAAVEAVSRCREDSIARSCSLTLLLLARCLRLCDLLGPREYDAGRGGWHGITVSWLPDANPRPEASAEGRHLPEDLVSTGVAERLSFPELQVDQRWIHSQHGSRQHAGGSTAERVTAQMDARFDSQEGCYLGHWIEHDGSEPLPLRAFPFAVLHEGLREWVALRAGRGITTKAASTTGLVRELFGMAGGRSGEVLRCFHLARVAG
mmetsp:Transcript_1345/g.3868  ORF Transcript_1345/g.3868 Transcript_1345/m.3868 type:complete len:503 (-) Transcript_1345:205-1713(-)